MKATLVVVAGRATQREVVVELPAAIGRDRQSALTVLHPTVSRRHCELVERDGNILLRDLGSTNGTFIDGQRISEVMLEPGVQFTVGPLTFAADYEPRNGEVKKDLPAPLLERPEPAPDEASEFDLLLDDEFAAMPAGGERSSGAPPVESTAADLPPLLADDEDLSFLVDQPAAEKPADLPGPLEIPEISDELPFEVADVEAPPSAGQTPLDEQPPTLEAPSVDELQLVADDELPFAGEPEAAHETVDLELDLAADEDDSREMTAGPASIGEATPHEVPSETDEFAVGAAPAPTELADLLAEATPAIEQPAPPAEEVAAGDEFDLVIDQPPSATQPESEAVVDLPHEREFVPAGPPDNFGEEFRLEEDDLALPDESQSPPDLSDLEIEPVVDKIDEIAAEEQDSTRSSTEPADFEIPRSVEPAADPSVFSGTIDAGMGEICSLSTESASVAGEPIDDLEEIAPIEEDSEPLAVGPAEPWDLHPAELSPAENVAEQPPAPAVDDELEFLDFDEPVRQNDGAALEFADQPADDVFDLTSDGGQDDLALDFEPVEEPPDQPVAGPGDAEIDELLASPPAAESSGVETTAAEIAAESDLPAFDSGESSELEMESLDLGIEEEPVADLDLDEPESTTPVAESKTDQPPAKPQETRKRWWPFSRRKKEIAEPAAVSEPQVNEAIAPAEEHEELAETGMFEEAASASETAAGASETGGEEADFLSSLELEPLDAADEAAIDQDLALDLDEPAGQRPVEAAADDSGPDSARTEEIALDDPVEIDPLADLERKEARLMDEPALDPGVGDLPSPATGSDDLAETTEFIPSELAPDIEWNRPTDASATPAASPKKKGFRLWPFGRKSDSAGAKTSPPAKPKKDKKTKKGDDPVRAAPVEQPPAAALSELPDIDFLSGNDAAQDESTSIADDAGRTTPAAGSSGKKSKELSDAELDEFLKGF